MPQKPKLVTGRHYLVNPINVTIIKFSKWHILGIILDEFVTSKKGSLCNNKSILMLVLLWFASFKLLTLEFLSKMCKKTNCLSLYCNFSKPKNSIITTNYLVLAIFNTKLASNNHHQKKIWCFVSCRKLISKIHKP
jgi:hypothetical protein